MDPWANYMHYSIRKKAGLFLVEQVATASYGHRYPRPARLKVASVEVSRAAALEGPMRRF